MNDEILSEDARRAKAELAALHTLGAPDPEYRARLRREFAAGVVTPVAGAEPTRSEPAADPSRILALPRRPRAARWSWAIAAAAAALVATGLLLNPGPRWSVVTATGAGVATVDGRPVPMIDAPKLSAALEPGARVRIPADGVLEIGSAGMLAIHMAPGTEAVIPHVPGRWFGRAVHGEIYAGEWRITTGGDFPGAQFSVTTPSAHIEVTGTTLAVICQPEGTCVCVYEGHVRVGRGPTEMANVQSGRRLYVYADTTRVPLDDAMLPPERPALGGFCESMRPLLRRPR